jgi:hypothetical protein
VGSKEEYEAMKEWEKEIAILKLIFEMGYHLSIFCF